MSAFTVVRKLLYGVETGALTPQVEALPANRVQVVWHPRGWQVAIMRTCKVEILPYVHADSHDAERKAAVVALAYDLTLYLHNDPGGEIAADRVAAAAYEDEQYERYTRWML